MIALLDRQLASHRHQPELGRLASPDRRHTDDELFERVIVSLPIALVARQLLQERPSGMAIVRLGWARLASTGQVTAVWRGGAFMASAHKSMRVIAGSRDGFADYTLNYNRAAGRPQLGQSALRASQESATGA